MQTFSLTSYVPRPGDRIIDQFGVNYVIAAGEDTVIKKDQQTRFDCLCRREL